MTAKITSVQEYSRMAKERKPASEEKKSRLRDSRAAASAAPRAKDKRREEHEHEVAVRMTRRFFPPVLYPEGPPLLAIDYRYWQARRCGWDAMAPNPDVAGDVLRGFRYIHPMSDSEWRWWTRLHYETRGKLVALSQFRLTRR